MQVEDVTISCCLCGQDFNSRRSIRRHCRKMHQTKLEELRKFTETRTVPTSLLSMVKGTTSVSLGQPSFTLALCVVEAVTGFAVPGGRPRTLSTPTGKSCPVCLKSFATKANVRRHFDEVHRGLRRDTITPGIASQPGPPFSPEATPPRKNNNNNESSSNGSPMRGPNTKSTPVNSKTHSSQNQAKGQSQANPNPSPASCRCTVCKRNYSSQVSRWRFRGGNTLAASCVLELIPLLVFFQLMLKRHMRIVHKVYSLKSSRSPAATGSSTPAAQNSSGGGSAAAANNNNNNVRVKEEVVETSDEDEDMDSNPAPSPSDSTGPAKGVAVTQSAPKVKDEEAPLSPKTVAAVPPSSSRGTTALASGASSKLTKLSVGFDFKQLYCKLCKRQFSSRQNLTKHIELHTDGNDIFIKFYRCPLCRYESRRKRDVLRHVTVVHKKSSAYLAKIMPKLESRAVKRLAEAVLSSTNPSKRTAGNANEEVNGRQASSSSSSPSPPITRKQEGSAGTPSTSAACSSSSQVPSAVTRRQQETSSPAVPASTPVTRKQERQQTHLPRPVSPPLTRRSEKHQRQSSRAASPSTPTPHTRRHDTQPDGGGTSSTEVRVTKNFSLHACDQCGRAFAKKVREQPPERHRVCPQLSRVRF